MKSFAMAERDLSSTTCIDFSSVPLADVLDALQYPLFQVFITASENREYFLMRIYISPENFESCEPLRILKQRIIEDIEKLEFGLMAMINIWCGFTPSARGKVFTSSDASRVEGYNAAFELQKHLRNRKFYFCSFSRIWKHEATLDEKLLILQRVLPEIYSLLFKYTKKIFYSE